MDLLMQMIIYFFTAEVLIFGNLMMFLNRITRNKNFYSKKNYYWLTFGGGLGKRMKMQISENSPPILTQTTTKAFRFQDNDNRNLIGSGLLNIEDDYTSSNKTKTYTNMLDGRIEGSTINYTFQFVNGSQYCKFA